MKRFCGCLLGVVLAVAGLLGLASEIFDQKSNFIFFGYVFSGLFLIGGVLLISGLVFRYDGGLWSAGGYILVALGTLYGSSMLDDFLKQEKPSSSDSLICSVLLLLGVSFLVHGHKRHAVWKANGLSSDSRGLSSAGGSQPRSMLRSLPFVPAWLGFVFGAWFVWHYYNTGLKLRAFEETCRVDGLSLDIDALNKLYAAIPVQQNAATVYEQAFTNLVGADTTVIE